MDFRQELRTLSILSNDFYAFKTHCSYLINKYDIESFHSRLQQLDLPTFDGSCIDDISRSILPECAESFIPIEAYGDGNCLFNSASLLLCGYGTLSIELRFRTVLELATNIEYYTNYPLLCSSVHFYTKETIYDIAAFSTSSSVIFKNEGFQNALQNEITLTSKNYSYSGVLQIAGLASVMGKSLKTCYPDQAYRLLNIYQNIYRPRFGRPENSEYYFLLWTNTNGWHDRNKSFVANHFVPLIEKNQFGELFEYTNKVVEKIDNDLTIENYFIVTSDDEEENFVDNLVGKPPLSLPQQWYRKQASTESKNKSRNDRRKSESIINNKSPNITVKTCIVKLKKDEYQLNFTDTRKIHLKALIKTAEYFLVTGPIVKTQDLFKVYHKEKSSSNSVHRKSKEVYEMLHRYFPVCQVYVNNVAYIIEDKYNEVIAALQTIKNIIPTNEINKTIEEQIGDIYKDAIDYMDTKRDRDVLKGLIAKITSIKFASRLGQKRSRTGVRNATKSLNGKLLQYSGIVQTSRTVRNDLTCQQQDILHKRIMFKRKNQEIKTIAEGRGAIYKCEQFPDMAIMLEGIFGERGLESHPRLSESTLYRANCNILSMKKAREILLTLSPPEFSISLSTCFNYTQNFKAGTAQAKRHHEGKNINACLSLHPPPRIGVENLVVNLHWSSKNVNHLLEYLPYCDTIFDSKDAKSIVCGDISPVQRPGKTWKKREGILPDHEWDQSRRNAVTPMTHLFLLQEQNAPEIVLRTGKGAVLLNLSLYEPSTTFRCLNEFFKLLTIPELDQYFRNKETGKLKRRIINIVDNGPAEQPASPLVQMLIVRMLNFMKFSCAGQVAFAEYHSKRNFVERVHAEENLALSRHGPFNSSQIHKNASIPSDDHRLNMEKMAKDVTDCLKSASFGKKQLTALRGVTDEEFIFNDEANLKTFLSLSEGKKFSFTKSYKANNSSLLEKLNAIWDIDKDFAGTYVADYKRLTDEELTWKDKYTFFTRENDQCEMPLQPIPDYLRWLNTSELHYIDIQMRVKIPHGTWDELPGMFLPSSILEKIYDTVHCKLSTLPSTTLNAISFLCWISKKFVSEYLNAIQIKEQEEIRKAHLRDSLKENAIFRKNILELEKECTAIGLNHLGTKLEIAERIAVHQKIKLNDCSSYNGDLGDIPTTATAIRKLGKHANTLFKASYFSFKRQVERQPMYSSKINE